MNIKNIFNRESIINIKKRKLLVSLVVVMSIYTVVMLIILNNIIVETEIFYFINYQTVLMMIKFSMMFEIFLCFIFSLVFLSMSIVEDKKDMILQNILCSFVTKKDIIMGKYLNGVVSVICVVCSCLPISFISLFFGGFDIKTLISYFIFLFFIILFSCAISMLFSVYTYNVIISLFFNILFFVIFFIFIYLFIDYILKYYLIVAIICLLSITLLSFRIIENAPIFSI